MSLNRAALLTANDGMLRIFHQLRTFTYATLLTASFVGCSTHVVTEYGGFQEEDLSEQNESSTDEARLFARGGSESTPRGRMVPLGYAKELIGTFAWPCGTKEISSQFGKRSRDFHEGVDIRAPKGTPIYAAHDGKVIFSGKGLRGYGRLIAIKGDGFMTVYAHTSRNDVDKYEYVRKGEKIGATGDSGTTTGPHLHFEVRLIDQKGLYHAVNPLVFYR